MFVADTHASLGANAQFADVAPTYEAVLVACRRLLS